MDARFPIETLEFLNEKHGTRSRSSGARGPAGRGGHRWRGRYDLGGALIGRDVVHAVTSLDAGRASAADLAAIIRGQRGIESVRWC